MNTDHMTASEREDYLRWAAVKVMQGRSVSADTYMELLNGGYLSLTPKEEPQSIGFSLVQ